MGMMTLYNFSGKLRLASVWPGGWIPPKPKWLGEEPGWSRQAAVVLGGGKSITRTRFTEIVWAGSD